MPHLTERFHLIATAAWCVVGGGILGFAPEGTALPRWLFVGMAASGVAGLMKAVTGVALGEPSARFDRQHRRPRWVRRN